MDSVGILYGRETVPLRMDPALAEWHLIRPRHEPPLDDPAAAFVEACRAPIHCDALQDLVTPEDRIVITTADGTRPVPNHKLIPWLLDELDVPESHITVLLGTGSHRANTAEEVVSMFGSDAIERVCVVNHDAYDPALNVEVGRTEAGAPICLSKRYVEADIRIVVGFIEPHFFAGFSGGPKAVAPGVCSIETIHGLHRYDLIAHPESTWGVLDGNPLHEAVCEAAACCPPDFLVNVALNNDKAITALFAGDYLAAHRAGCEHVRERAMAPVPHRFPLVVASNSGHPLDQNLYQTVKGMSAAARIVEDGGAIAVAAECADGVPDHGNFGAMLRDGKSIDALDAQLQALPEPVLDQWQVQVLVNIRKQCGVDLYSTLDPDTVRQCHLNPIADLQTAVEERLRALGPGTPVAVMPEGPLTIPYVA